MINISITFKYKYNEKIVKKIKDLGIPEDFIYENYNRYDEENLIKEIVQLYVNRPKKNTVDS